MKKGAVFLFILIFISAQMLFAAENAEKNLLNSWEDFCIYYSQIDFNKVSEASPKLEKLIFYLNEYTKSDAYIINPNGSKTESVIYIDTALEHAQKALLFSQKIVHLLFEV